MCACHLRMSGFQGAPAFIKKSVSTSYLLPCGFLRDRREVRLASAILYGDLSLLFTSRRHG